MLTYTLKKEPGKSLYTALYEAVRTDIATGKLPAGMRLPSKRALAANLGVSVVTVESAYAQLIAEGYAEARERSGIYVCAIGNLPRPDQKTPTFPERKSPAALLDVSGGTGEDAPFPFSVWVKTMRTVMGEKGKEILQPVEFSGAIELREAIASHLYQSRGLNVSPRQIVVGAGNEYLYGLLVQLLGRSCVFGVENPGYRKISGIYRANDVEIRHIPLDEQGMSVRALEESGAEIAHISPAHHYPTGIVMPIRRRNELLDWAYAREGRYIIEDDYDSELRHSGKPVPPLFSLDGRERVLYLSTFTQTISPSLRIAYVCLPPHLMHRLHEKLGFYTCAVPTFEQYTLARFISSGDYERHLNRLKKRLREKRLTLLEQIEKDAFGRQCRIVEKAAGTHFLLKLKTERSDADLKKMGEEVGLSLRFLSDYETGQAEQGNLIVNYACLNPARLPGILEKLQRLCQRPPEGHKAASAE